MKYLHGHVVRDYFLEASVHNDADSDCSYPILNLYRDFGLREIMWESKHHIWAPAVLPKGSCWFKRRCWNCELWPWVPNEKRKECCLWKTSFVYILASLTQFCLLCHASWALIISLSLRVEEWCPIRFTLTPWSPWTLQGTSQWYTRVSYQWYNISLSVALCGP